MKTRLHVELDAAALLAVPQVERRVRRDVQQLRVFAAAFDRLCVQASGARSRARRACRTRRTAPSVISDLARAHSAEAWLIGLVFVGQDLLPSSSSSHSSFFIRIGSVMWSEYLRMIERSFHATGARPRRRAGAG